MGNRIIKIFSKFYMLLIFTFLYFPIFIIVIYSFNASKSNVLWTGFTMDWYKKLLEDENVIIALQNSLKIAFSSTIISSIIGTTGAVAMYKYNFRGKKGIDLLLYIQIIIPEIIMGVSLLNYFSVLNMEFGLFTLILAHTTFCIPFVYILVKARLAGFNSSIEEAALDLGAGKFTVFRTVTFPLILPGIISGAALAFAISFDDVIINFFVSGPESTTLPIKIFSMLRFGLSPEINALCSIMLIITLFVLMASQSIRIKKQN
ncbi:MAG TPA: ABC transporter permease subunit [Clostridiaceae bacterium]